MCSHIRRSTDRSLFAAPRGLSQLVTSFFGSWCQGIRPMLFFAWTSYLYSLFSELLEFLRKQDKFRIEKVYPFRVVLFSTFRWNCNLLPKFGKTQSHLINCVLFICSFFQLISNPINWILFFTYSIVKFHVALSFECWSVWMDSNHRPRAYQARALATWATDRFFSQAFSVRPSSRC